jgi:ribosomal protein L11 methyltransferase
MADYIKAEFEFLSNEQKEMIIALLTEMNYEGFEEEGDLLKAYIFSDRYNEDELRTVANSHELSYTVTVIEDRNWNQIWESNFQPVIINHSIRDTPWVAIRADFHQPIRHVEHEIIITPKMSFGTGHHATTSMMIKMMSELDFAGKKVLDFGTGTGILAIIAERLGATEIIAIDNDDQSIINAKENLKLNSSSNIEIIKASSAEGNNRFDIILANIIRTVISRNLHAFTKQLAPGGLILLSGLLQEDEKEILQFSIMNNLVLQKKIEDKNWIGLQMIYKSNVMHELN